VSLLLVAGFGFAVSLIVRPPADTRAAALRIALGLSVMFTLAPATRWGYFVYPIGLIGWLALTKQGSAPQDDRDSGDPVLSPSTAAVTLAGVGAVPAEPVPAGAGAGPRAMVAAGFRSRTSAAGWPGWSAARVKTTGSRAAGLRAYEPRPACLRPPV
jgi:hypothetical protein